MKKLLSVPFALMVLSACAESPTGLMPGESLRFASHTSIPDPTNLSYDVDGTDVTISWDWQDNEDWDLVSFKLTKDGLTVPTTVANQKPYDAETNLVLNRSALVEDAEEGTYCVEVMAKLDGSPALTHHSYDCIEVSLDEPIRFQVLIRNQSNTLSDSTAFNGRAGTWNYQFIVKIWDGSSFVTVTDCGDLAYGDITAKVEWATPSAATGTASPVAGEECLEVGALGGAATYKVSVANAFQNSSSTGLLTFRIDGVVNENEVEFNAPN